ncbi:DNA-binding response regulator [Sphingomonas ginkgonis]|uniref:DNA-binding response regulator n=1 Tax=Sphingomonas ginkgonis TaxID=2315330 RepID=A0A429VC47_9SPHN|nr:response regulator transcription factor [Sphingomonas ginkgonis]RST31575.1 DNA-binding response regulator [Sphingomonas ginkgonis]
MEQARPRWHAGSDDDQHFAREPRAKLQQSAGAGHATDGQPGERGGVHVLIADDHDLLRDSLAAFLNSDGEFRVSEAADLGSALRMARAGGRFDLVLLDYSMPGMNGFDGLGAMLAASPGTPVAVMSGALNPMLGERALERGAAGFIPKTLAARELVAAIRTMIGGARFTPDPEWKPERAPVEPGVALSRREEQVLGLLNGGLTNREIAERLGLQEVTAKLHVKNLCRKLDARNRTHAVLIGQQLGLI